MVTIILYQIIFVALAWYAFNALGSIIPRYTVSSAFAVFALIYSMYFGMSLVFAKVDTSHKPEWLYRRKYQKDACVTPEKYQDAFKQTTLKFVTVLLPYFIAVFYLMKWRVARFPHVATNSFLAFLCVLIVVYVIAEFSAWFIHKVLHKGVLWDKIHSVHHKYVATVAVASLDAHPVEMILWDAVPFTLGPLLLGTSPAFFLVFALLSIVNTILCHCGYDIGYDQGHHDMHHERLKCNYSGFLSDWVMGTYVPREKNKIYPRFDQFQKDLIGTMNETCDSLDGHVRANHT
jgi:sterol desaturase/sphingolipid hydroxylase (fatty acid hydroxylase superfamily)